MYSCNDHYGSCINSKKSRLALTVSANRAPQKCMQIPMDRMCKHQQLLDAVAPGHGERMRTI